MATDETGSPHYKKRMRTGMPTPYGTAAWRAWQQQQEAAEIAARPVTNRPRRPLTPSELDSFRPKLAR